MDLPLTYKCRELWHAVARINQEITASEFSKKELDRQSWQITIDGQFLGIALTIEAVQVSDLIKSDMHEELLSGSIGEILARYRTLACSMKLPSIVD